MRPIWCLRTLVDFSKSLSYAEVQLFRTQGSKKVVAGMLHIKLNGIESYVAKFEKKRKFRVDS